MVDEYSSESIKILKMPEAVRARPGMYLGEINSLAVNALTYELVSNAIDQFLMGNVSTIKVIVNEDIVTVIDDGIGLPFDKPSTDNSLNLLEYYLTNSHNSPTADNHAPHIHVLNYGGLGMGVVNATSNWMKIQSSNGINQYTQMFGKGKILGIPKIEETESDSGTRIDLKADSEIFQGFQLDILDMRKKLFEVSHFYPGLIIEFQKERFISQGGLLDLAYFQNSDLSQFSNTELTKFSIDETKDNLRIQVGALGVSEKNTIYKSWVNGVETKDGGTHVYGLEKAFKHIGWFPEVAYIHVIMYEPKFANPVKDKLKNSKVVGIVEELLTSSLNKFFGGEKHK